MNIPPWRWSLCWLVAWPVTLWAWWYERMGQQKGRILNEEEQSLAQRLEIVAWPSLRVVIVEQMPFLGPLWLQRVMARWGCSPQAVLGLCLRYSIYLKPEAQSLSILAHELVHTKQYERSGSLHAFLTEYIAQCWHFGYHAAPWESEAHELSAQLAYS